MRRPAAAAGLLLGVCGFCVALAALEARQSAAQEHGGDTADALQQSEQLRRLQEQTGGRVTDARVLVVPRFGCQLVDANETECMASLDAAQSKPCREKAMTGALALTLGRGNHCMPCAFSVSRVAAVCAACRAIRRA